MEKWFDSTVYMQNKLAQMQATDPAYTMTQLVAAFAAAGFVGEEGYFNHFMQFGAAEEVAPNAYFNADEYYAAKAAQFYGDKFDGSEFQIAQVKALINQAGMNAWTHYQQFGSAEGVNPSNAFDASDYCAAKADAMNAAGQKDPDGNAWTAESIAKAIDDAGMSVLEHYMTYAGTGEGEVAAGTTFPVPEDEQAVVSKPGETFLLTEKIDDLKGTAGEDIFKADDDTLNVGDSVDGGAGNDTLEVYTDDTLAGTFTNIENLVVAGAGVAGSYDLSSFSKSFTLKVDEATGVTNVAGQKLVLDGVGTQALSVKMAADQASVELVSQNRSGVNTFTLEAGDALKSVNLTLDEAASSVKVTGTKAASIETLAVNAVESSATNGATVDLISLTGLRDITVTGDASVTLSAVAMATKLETLNASGTTGGVTVDGNLANTAVFTGGEGDDTITLGASTKAHDMGAGDDTVVLDGSALGKDGSVDGGDGVDTLAMSADNAGSMTAANFKAFTNFEVLGLNGGAGTIQLDNFGDINHVTIAQALSEAVTIEDMDSNGTLEFNIAAGQDITVNVTEASEDGHTTDVLNVKLSAADSIENAANQLTVAAVETINIEADDADDDGDAAHTLQLVADAVKTVNVTGDADLTLSGTFVAGATIDISANTADVTFTANTIDSSKVTDENTLVTLKGFTDGDTIKINGEKTDVLGAKMELGTNWDIQDCLTNAAKQEGKAAWFEFGGNTYILFDENDTLDSADYIVKLAGTDYDLKGLNLDSGELTLGA